MAQQQLIHAGSGSYNKVQLFDSNSAVEIRRTIGHFLWMSDKNVRVPDQMSDKKYKNIHLVDEKKQNTSDHKGQQLGFRSSRCFCRHLYSTLNFRWSTFFL